MRRLVTYISIGLLTFIVGVSACIFWWWNYSHRPTPETFQAKISEYNQLIQSEIPVGSSVSQVEAFLDARKIEHSGFVNHLDVFRWDSAFDELDFPSKQEIIKGYVGAIIRDADYEPLIQWHIQMRFYFDERGKLVTHTVRWTGTGL